MSIGITDEHVELATSLRKWATSLDPIGLVRAAEVDADAAFGPVWDAAEEMGVTTIGLAESAGGGGGSILDVAVALEACAHELVPGPLLGPAVVSSVLARCGTDVELPDGVIGIVLGDLAWDAPSATHFLLADADGTWQLVPGTDVTFAATIGLDLSRRCGSVSATSWDSAVAIPGLTTEQVRRAAVTLAAAEAAGVARWCLETAVSYAKVREQFGQKIGAFQAVKHLCAQMLEAAEAVTAAAWDVATAADASGGLDDVQWAFAADVAVATCFDGAVEVAKTCVQVLGGIGFTFEHDTHLYLRRAMALRAVLGGSDEAAERLTAAAVTGVRRAVGVDLDGRDEPIRAGIAAQADALATVPTAELWTALVDCGYLTPHWPVPYGLSADPVTQIVIDQELDRAGVERPDISIAGWAIPTILEHGSDAQRDKLIRPSLTGELIWCQLFSEPGSGSDLASLRTRAEKVDGGWRLNGQKVWTSVAEKADWGMCLARTDPGVKQHQGISYFLVDMRSAGIDVRPLREMTGRALFNEVFLDDVFVPDDCLVAGLGDGWKLARTTLANERIAMAGSQLSVSTEKAIDMAASGLSDSQRVHVGHSIALATVCSRLALRSTLRSLAGQGPGAESSVSKLLGVRNRQDGAELVVALHGDKIMAPDDEVRHDVEIMLNTRCLSIAGGTTQILRNVAGERILGLPRG